MKRISSIVTLLKRIYRPYNKGLIQMLREKGFNNLRPSFLDILLYICENNNASVCTIGKACALKKQTMTGHLNELEKRGYVIREMDSDDKRKHNVILTEQGKKFKLSLYECLDELEKVYCDQIGERELDTIEYGLKNLHSKINKSHLRY